MMKSLFPEIDWDKITVVGFDMDGTLYDEIEFIQQVYVPISRYMASVCRKNAIEIYTAMLARWLEKGSSYPYIFSEIFEKYAAPGMNKKEDVVKECVSIFRSFVPALSLSKEVKELLSAFNMKYRLFLVTDGQALLQTRKFESLGLSYYFKRENVGISGVYGREYEKPSLNILSKIDVLKNVDPRSVVYFGDRDVDSEFARRAGFHFVKVKCMRKGVRE